MIKTNKTEEYNISIWEVEIRTPNQPLTAITIPASTSEEAKIKACMQESIKAHRIVSVINVGTLKGTSRVCSA
jgi:hypothetical protein